MCRFRRLASTPRCGVERAIRYPLAVAWFLFVDESGHDCSASPYEVLAGVAIQDRAVREIIQRLHQEEVRSFGRRYSAGPRELKGRILLKTKVYRHRDLNVEVADEDVPALAHAALDDGARADARMLKALAMAEFNYVASVFNVCSELGCRAFASIVETDARPTASGGLRKDYAYPLERFFYFLEDHTEGEQGIVVFDELDKARSHLLIDQMRRYFADTMVGRRRSNHIIPEPFFVHSDLTTGVQIADLVAYVISWGFRTSRMIKPARSELSQFSAQVANLRYRATRSRMDNPEFGIWSFAHITDLRTQAERDGVP